MLNRNCKAPTTKAGEARFSSTSARKEDISPLRRPKTKEASRTERNVLTRTERAVLRVFLSSADDFLDACKTRTMIVAAMTANRPANVESEAAAFVMSQQLGGKN